MTESGARGTVMLVGTNSVYLMVADDILKLAGYTTTRASSTKHAQELIVKQLPNLILLDLPPRGVDGRQLLRMFRSSPLTERIPVIVLVQADATDQMAAIAAGFESCVVTPIQRAELLKAVREALEQDT